MAVFRRGFLPVAAGAVLAIGLAACGSSAASSGGTSDNAAGGSGECSNIPAGPIKLADIVLLSGPTATSGELTAVESTIMVNYFNAHDSVCGHKFTLPTTTTKATRRPRWASPAR
jgi:hypothetical protein